MIIRKNKDKKRRKKVVVCIGGVVAFLFLLYFGIALFFMDHFFVNTVINGHDFSGKTLEDATRFYQTQLKGYALSIKEKGKCEVIKGEDIALEYQENDVFENILKRQNAFLWLGAAFFKSDVNTVVDLSYDEVKLKEIINKLNLMSEEQVSAQSAYPEFDGEQYVIHPETYGTVVDEKILEENIVSAIMQLEPELELEEEQYYIMPEYTSESKEVKQACSELNQYCQASITYPMNEPVVVDKKLISTWLSVDEKMKVTLDEEAVRNWLSEFGNQYDTVGNTRNFTTITGKNATVTGGTYGWSINEESECATLLADIKNGTVITREPVYYIGGTAAVHAMPDWGNTYVEVDLTLQHMWYVVDGVVVQETDVVTGEPIPEKITPEGTYSLQEKLTDTYLIGEIQPDTGEPAYRTHVSYWMRITWKEGIGFHDAIWQSGFGGKLYQIPNIGSHGCINMPLDQAAALYGMIEIGTPVIIHY